MFGSGAPRGKMKFKTWFRDARVISGLDSLCVMQQSLTLSAPPNIYFPQSFLHEVPTHFLTMPSATVAPEWLLISGRDVSYNDDRDLALVQDGDFNALFEDAREIIGFSADDDAAKGLAATLDYHDYVTAAVWARYTTVPENERTTWLLKLMCVGVGALRAYLQANVTGPPLSYNPDKLLVPTHDMDVLKALNKAAITSLTVDGESAYHLAKYPLLLVFATSVLNCTALATPDAPETVSWWRLRANFLHQRVLSEKTGTLHKFIVDGINETAEKVAGKSNTIQSAFLVEKAMVNIYFGKEQLALKELEEAAELSGLKYVLTGVVGKRTKFQQNETSQLVVLAKSAEQTEETSRPQTLDLNDDSLLEKISFTEATAKEDGRIPAELAELDPGNQPPLHPLDATILLLLTETIKNTNPADGITREQMMPYAERVLSHSTNWEVYTLGLLVKSRIESSKTRTVERSVLQLQTLVDQVIAATTDSNDTTVTSFLPRATEEESAPIRERLLYIHQLPIPTRWELEAELASGWSSLGGLRTAVEIYERLEMWAEAALCFAATDQEKKARTVILDQLFEPGHTQERTPPPPQTPRLWCILGDIDEKPEHYEKAWTVSNNRYARAKRSLGRYYIAKHEYQKAADAYGDSLRIYPLHGHSWFALGCCWLELEAWEGAVRAFRRAINIDDTDAEAWSNLATALLRRGVDTDTDTSPDTELGPTNTADPQQHRRDALRALRRATHLKRESWRIWENYLTVTASLDPPEFSDIVAALQTLISLRKDSKGELAVDADVLDLLVQHVITNNDNENLAKSVIRLVDNDVVPLITTNDRLWKLVGRVYMWRKKPRAALEAREKAWRAVSSRPGITDTEKTWEELVDATVELADAYRNLGPMERTDGLGAGEPVAKDWKFKARSVVRGVCGRGKQSWEGTSGWERLVECLEELKQAA